jgi:hypothetical protein
MTPAVTPGDQPLVIRHEQMNALGAARGCTVVPCPKVTVTIKLPAPVACPGRIFSVTAEGSPPGGTFKWTVTGGPPGFIHRKNNSDGLDLNAFNPDNETGNIPEAEATVSVVYKHPIGSANDSKQVKFHKIDFEVTPFDVKLAELVANDAGDKLVIDTNITVL